MLISLDNYIVRAQNGYVSTRHFSIQQDVVTTVVTSNTGVPFQISPLILKIESTLPTGVTGYRLVSAVLTSSASTGTWFLIKKYDLAKVTFLGGSGMTYTDLNTTLPIKTIGNASNQTSGPLCIFPEINTASSAAVFTINYLDENGNNQTINFNHPNSFVKNSFAQIPTPTRIANISNITRVTGTLTAGGVLVFCSYELLGIFNNPQAVASVPAVLNNFLTGNIPLLQTNDELYILYYATTPSTAKAWVGEITLVGEEN